MQHRFAAQQARLSAFIGNGFNHVAKTTRFSPFQWTICGLLAVLALFLGFCLVSIRSNTADLNANMRDNTRAVSELRSDLAKSFDSIDRKIADSNQKLSDLAVELDDLITEQKKASNPENDSIADPKQKPNAKDASSARATPRSALVVHRRHSVRGH